jgi:hypothetical protein
VYRVQDVMGRHMQAKFTVDVHADVDTLEEYVIGRLPESAIEPLEEHLLICPRCQAAVAEIDEYVSLMKHAMAKMAAKRPGAKRLEVEWTLSRSKRIGIGVTITAVFLGWMLIRAPRTVPEANSVQLIALRGDDMASIAHTRSGPVDLGIDVSDLPGIASFGLEVVDAAGQRQWNGTAAPSGGKLTVRVAKGLAPGVYWVRLSAAGGELLREFGLRAD